MLANGEATGLALFPAGDGFHTYEAAIGQANPGELLLELSADGQPWPWLKVGE